MEKLRLTLSLFVLAVAATATLCCGMPSLSHHQLTSITLSPTMADAQNYPQGLVQFTATGYYMTAPLVVTPLSATWGACYQLAPTSAVSISSTGLAQCASGAAGTYFIWANDPIGDGTYSCPAQTACGGGCTVQATALLTCP